MVCAEVPKATQNGVVALPSASSKPLGQSRFRTYDAYRIECPKKWLPSLACVRIVRAMVSSLCVCKLETSTGSLDFLLVIHGSTTAKQY